MATKTRDEAAQVNTTEAVECTQSTYEGNEMFSVGPVGGRFKANLQASFKKWARLLGKDEDGDPALLNLLNFLLEQSEDETEVFAQMDEVVVHYFVLRQAKLGGDNTDLTDRIAEAMPEA